MPAPESSRAGEVRAAIARLRNAAAASGDASTRVIAALQKAALILSDAREPVALDLRRGLQEETGLSMPMIEWGLLTSLSSMRHAPLAELARVVPADAPREVIGVVLAGNVFVAAVRGLAMPLLAGAHVIAKTASREGAFAQSFHAALKQADPEIGARLTVVQFSREDQEATRALCTGVDALSVYGSDETVAQLQSLCDGRAAVGGGARWTPAARAETTAAVNDQSSGAPSVTVRGEPPAIKHNRQGTAETDQSSGASSAADHAGSPVETLALEDSRRGTAAKKQSSGTSSVADRAEPLAVADSPQGTAGSNQSSGASSVADCATPRAEALAVADSRQGTAETKQTSCASSVADRAEPLAVADSPQGTAETNQSSGAPSVTVRQGTAESSCDAPSCTSGRGPRIIAHGHGLSAAYVARSALSSPEQAARTAERVALDVSAYDQHGCLSPHFVLVEPGGAIDPRAFAQLLAASALPALARLLPAAEPTLQEQAERMQWQATAAVRGELHVHPTHAVSFEDAPLRPSPGGRQIGVYACVDHDELHRLLTPFAEHLKCVGVAGTRAERATLSERLQRFCTAQVCRSGEMQSPPFDAWADGAPPLAGLFRS